jgi:hypothetical protein
LEIDPTTLESIDISMTSLLPSFKPPGGFEPVCDGDTCLALCISFAISRSWKWVFNFRIERDITTASVMTIDMILSL